MVENKMMVMDGQSLFMTFWLLGVSGIVVFAVIMGRQYERQQRQASKPH